MARQLESIDITEMPELRRLAEEVDASREPRLLVRGDVQVAVIAPVSSGKGLGRKSAADLAAFRAAAGSWRDNVDTEKLKRDIAESRRISTRPHVEL
jgi:hypothetical protein